MDDRWLALYVAIVHPREILINDAINLLAKGTRSRLMGDGVTPEEINECRDRGMTWEQIGEFFGIKRTTANSRHARWLRRQEAMT